MNTIFLYTYLIHMGRMRHVESVYHQDPENVQVGILVGVSSMQGPCEMNKDEI